MHVINVPSGSAMCHFAENSPGSEGATSATVKTREVSVLYLSLVATSRAPIVPKQAPLVCTNLHPTGLTRVGTGDMTSPQDGGDTSTR